MVSTQEAWLFFSYLFYTLVLHIHELYPLSLTLNLNSPWNQSLTPAPSPMSDDGKRLCWEVQCLDRHWLQMLWRYQETAADSETEDIKNKEYKFYLLLVFVLIIFVFAVWFLTANIHLDLWKSSSWSFLTWFLFVLYFLRCFQPTQTFLGVGIINVQTFTASTLIPIPN